MHPEQLGARAHVGGGVGRGRERGVVEGAAVGVGGEVTVAVVREAGRARLGLERR